MSNRTKLTNTEIDHQIADRFLGWKAGQVARDLGNYSEGPICDYIRYSPDGALWIANGSSGEEVLTTMWSPSESASDLGCIKDKLLDEGVAFSASVQRVGDGVIWQVTLVKGPHSWVDQHAKESMAFCWALIGMLDRPQPQASEETTAESVQDPYSGQALELLLGGLEGALRIVRAQVDKQPRVAELIEQRREALSEMVGLKAEIAKAHQEGAQEGAQEAKRLLGEIKGWREVMIDIVPGIHGEGEEIYARDPEHLQWLLNRKEDKCEQLRDKNQKLSDELYDVRQAQRTPEQWDAAVETERERFRTLGKEQILKCVQLRNQFLGALMGLVQDGVLPLERAMELINYSPEMWNREWARMCAREHQKILNQTPVGGA